MDEHCWEWGAGVLPGDRTAQEVCQTRLGAAEMMNMNRSQRVQLRFLEGERHNECLVAQPITSMER